MLDSDTAVRRYGLNTGLGCNVRLKEICSTSRNLHPLGTCSDPTNIEDLRRCIQRDGESTRKWLGRWSDLWNSSSGISADAAILIFRESCRFEPLVQKLQRTKTPVTTISALMEIAGRYAGSDPTKDDSDGEHDARREIERHRDNRRNGGRDNCRVAAYG